ncbi:SDR family NAD(P)-dependent oxidoreductase [Catenulispora yoronensis]
MDADELSRALSALADLPVDDPGRLRVERVAESLIRDGRKQRQRERRLRRDAADRELLATTTTGAADRREDTPLPEHTGSVGTLSRQRRCYVCKQKYAEVSAFYHQLCPECAAENLAWRSARTPLDGRRALVTGGRVKIGFQVALMLLRDGAAVRVVTRFPHDAVRRFRAVEDSAKWLDRLTVTGLDLRDPRQVVELCDDLLAAGEPLDILINNAAQTVRRPESSYAPLIAAERRAAAELGAGGPLRELALIAGYREIASASAPRAPSCWPRPPSTRTACSRTRHRATPGRPSSASWTRWSCWRCTSSTPSRRRCWPTGCCRC